MFERMGSRAALCGAILAAALAGCTQQPTPIPLPTITPTLKANPDKILTFNDCPPVRPASSGPGSYDGDDGFDTVQRGPLTLDAPGCSSNVTNLDAAENWTFAGTTGQDIVIRVQAYGKADPQLTIIDPNGDVVDVSDNIDGTSSQEADETLDMDGVYTLRVTMFAAGIYNINVQSGTPEP